LESGSYRPAIGFEYGANKANFGQLWRDWKHCGRDATVVLGSPDINFVFGKTVFASGAIAAFFSAGAVMRMGQPGCHLTPNPAQIGALFTKPG